MRIMMLRGAFTFAVLLMLSLPAVAQSLVSGRVFDPKNNPVEGATITFDAISFVAKREVKTNKNGEFLFQGLQSGEYKITASKDGVGTHTREATVSLQQKLQLTFNLRPEAPAGAGAAAGTAVAPGAPAPIALETIAKTPAKGDNKETAALQATAAAALEAYKAQRYDESVAKLTDVTAKMPGCADCFMYLGVSLFELKKLDEAEAALKKSVEVKPTVEGYTALTRFYNSQRKFDLAAETSQKAADLAVAPAPLPPPAATGSSLALPGTKPAAGAPAAGAPAAAVAPPPPPAANSETLFNQGVVNWNAKKYPEAKALFEAAVKANPNNADAQYQLGMANLNLGQIPDARAAFEAYLKAAPDGARAAEVKTYLTQLPK